MTTMHAAMQPQQERVSARTAGEHDALVAAMQRLEGALAAAAPGRERDWARRVGADLRDVRAFFDRPTTTGTPPVDGEGTRETAVLEGGDRQVTRLNLAAGRYALICFVRNRRGGPPHIELGMINEVTVR